jgi:FG-GAP repeat
VFGTSVCISSSGNVAIVGSLGEDSGVAGIVMNPTGTEPALTDSNVGAAGAAYVLERNSVTGNWSTVAFVKAPAVSFDDQFGVSVSISGDDRALVGAKFEGSNVPGTIMNPNGTEPALTDDSSSKSGAVYVLERDSSSGNWSTVAFVKPPATPANLAFGVSVSLSGDRAIVGSEQDSNVPGAIMNPIGTEPALTNSGATDSGAAYILERDSSTGAWSVVAFVKAPMVTASDFFGTAVSISGDRAIIGAYGEGGSIPGIVMYPNGTEPALTTPPAPRRGTASSGAAYVLNRDSSTGVWSFEAFVKAPAINPLITGGFGGAVAISGDRTLMGAIYEKSGFPGIVKNPTGSEAALTDESVTYSGAAYMAVFRSSGASTTGVPGTGGTPATAGTGSGAVSDATRLSLLFSLVQALALFTVL